MNLELQPEFEIIRKRITKTLSTKKYQRLIEEQNDDFYRVTHPFWDWKEEN